MPEKEIKENAPNWDQECKEALARLDSDPELLASYRAEAQQLAEVDVQVQE